MSGNPPGSLKQYMKFGHQNKCQETFWALQKHVFWAPKTNVRKLAGLSNNLYKSFVHQKQMSGLSKKPTGLSTKHEIWAPKHMSGNLLGSPELCVLGTQELAELSKKNFGHLSKSMSFGTKYQETRRALKTKKHMNFARSDRLAWTCLPRPQDAPKK